MGSTPLSKPHQQLTLLNLNGLLLILSNLILPVLTTLNRRNYANPTTAPAANTTESANTADFESARTTVTTFTTESARTTDSESWVPRHSPQLHQQPTLKLLNLPIVMTSNQNVLLNPPEPLCLPVLLSLNHRCYTTPTAAPAAHTT